jgi:two-component system, LytTR family, response regulator
MINCLIIDDEPLALDLLESYIKKISSLNLVDKCSESLVAMQYFDKHQVDLLFIDIQMPDLSGVDFIRALQNKPEVIFTTAFAEYALAGFELNAVDYLLKPFSFERFIASVNRAKDIIEYKSNKAGNGKDYFFIGAAHKIHKVFYRDILFLEGLKDYTKIHLLGKPPLLILQNLKYFEVFLPKKDFIRIHRSYIVSIQKLTTITKKIVTIENSTLPVGDNYRDRFFSIIQH